MKVKELLNVSDLLEGLKNLGVDDFDFVLDLEGYLESIYDFDLDFLISYTDKRVVLLIHSFSGKNCTEK